MVDEEKEGEVKEFDLDRDEELQFEVENEIETAVVEITKRKIDEVSAVESEHESVKKKKKISISRKPPTAEEIIRLKETESLFHSNLFRMQIEEVLLEVKPKKKDSKAIKIWLEKFLKFLSEIPESSTTYSLDDHSWLSVMRVHYPLPSLPTDSKAKFKFMKPACVKCIGSFSSDSALQPNYSVDIGITMPQNFFHKEDYLNCRYHKKRSLYLCHVAEYLLSSTALDSSTPPRFCLRSGNPLKPILLVKPSAQWSSRVKVYIHALPETGSFKLSRFLPTKNNVRQKWWSEVTVDDDLVATPYYNASIGQDLVSEINESLCNEIFEENPNLRDALLLLKIWLHQRELDEDPGGITGFILSMLLVYLFRNHKLNPLMSSYQVLRNTWLSLCQTDWLTNGLSLAQDSKGNTLLEEFNSNYEVVFVDLTGLVNLTSSVTKVNYIRLKEEARLAMKYLDNSCLNSFQALFMTHMPFLHQFDHVISLKTKKVLHVWDKIEKDKNKELDLLVDKQRLFISAVTDLLEKGVGNRISLIAVKYLSFNTWSIENDPPKTLCDSIVIGLKLNPETALSVIDKGPEANLPEGAEFRKFWSPKSELRRFQDGSTCESVVWDTPDAPFCRCRLITQRIVQFLLKNKFKLTKTSYVYVSNQLELLLKDKLLPDEVGSVEEQSLSAIKSLDGLIKQVRNITTLPLPVTSILGTSPVLRFADVFPPSAHEGYSTCFDRKGNIIFKEALKKAFVSVQSVEAVIQLGHSSRWPENVEAIRRIHAAFVIEIAKALKEQCNLLTQVFPDHDGYIFKLRVVYPREIALMKEIKTSEGLIAYRDTTESLKMEQHLLHLPKLTGTLHGLSLQFLSYGPTVCLVKRWLRAQMIDDELFPDVPLELIVASLFVSPEPFTIVLQPQTAFLRVLNILANRNWCLEPIIINFNQELTRDDITEIEQSFRTGRDNNSLPGLFIATSYDKTGIVWTRDAPTLPILFHVAKLAKESLSILETQLLLTENSEEFKRVFRPPLHFYDVIIYVNALKNPRRTQGIDWEQKHRNNDSLFDQSRNNIPVIEFNPVHCYLQELRENYGEFALFFHDTYGGEVIGVLFKPSVYESRDFKVSHVNGRKPVFEEKEPKLIFNKEAIVEDFHHIGKHVVKRIETKSTNDNS
ncbi:nucleolar protein 6 Mat89Ba isoform X2 [Lycorma delicatula]|uniref:nucleolar protein 6 Mat89Ba isoform X2 n=1 Tax=Lycorma delicatula TaxID=130591 RepID=UPI003F510540